MRELTISELEVIVGGMRMEDPGTINPVYEYNQSTFYEQNDGNWDGTAFESDSNHLQNEAQAMSIDWEVGGEVSNGGYKVHVKASGKC